MRKYEILTMLVLLFCCSCKTKVEDVLLSFDMKSENLCELQISNTSSKNFFLLLPSIYLKKYGCTKIYSITASHNLVGENFLCSGEVFTAPVLDRGLFSFKKQVHPQFSKCIGLASKMEGRWKNQMRSLCSETYGPQNVYFIKAGSAVEISFVFNVKFPSGEYEIFTDTWDLRNNQINKDFVEFKKELKRINKSDNYIFYETSGYEKKNIIGHFEIK